MLEISTDAHIIAACLEEPERFRELFERHFPATLGFLRRRVGPEIAEDLAIETFSLALTPLWRSNDPGLDVEGMDASDLAGLYVADVSPAAQDKTYVFVSRQAPPQPEPGTPLAKYHERLDRGC